MIPILSASIAALIAVLVIIRCLNPIAAQVGLLDQPNGRKQHTGSIPLTGGLSIYLALWASSLFLPEVSDEVAWLMGSASLLVLVGVIDDRRPLGVTARLGVQALATVGMIAGTGLYIHSPLPFEPFQSLPVSIGGPLTVVAVVGLINAFNMIDGIDGLAGGIAMVASLALCIGQFGFGTFQATGYLLVFCAAVLGYLLVNLTITTRKKVFLGDAGSLLIGHILAWAVIYLSQSNSPSLPSTFVIWTIALPVFDVFSVMIRRIKKGLSPFHADRTHLHHICMRAGLNPTQSLGLLMLFAMVLATLGLLASIFAGPLASTAFFGIAMASYLFGQARIWRLLVWFRRRGQSDLAT